MSRDDPQAPPPSPVSEELSNPGLLSGSRAPPSEPLMAVALLAGPAEPHPGIPSSPRTAAPITVTNVRDARAQWPASRVRCMLLLLACSTRKIAPALQVEACRVPCRGARGLRKRLRDMRK